MTKLSVNVNKIATLRNTRNNGVPDVTRLSDMALAAGADGITVHPRPDGRHIRSEDVGALAAVVARYPGAEYNIEGNPFHGLAEHCARVRPGQATLVPDAPGASTSDHGWNLERLAPTERRALAGVIDDLHRSGCRVSLFVDPVPSVMRAARALGADRVELYTEPYAVAALEGRTDAALQLYRDAARAARDDGLGVNAGHDLTLANLPPFLHALPEVDEVSIGHALIADALEIGLPEAVRRYRALCAGLRAA